MKAKHQKEASGGILGRAIGLFVLAAALFAVQDAAAASDAWTLISSSETNPAAPAPNWSPPDQGSGSYPMPALGDLDGDGDQDLLFGLSGSLGPTMAAYENTGTSAAPVWTAAPSSWKSLSSACPDGTFYSPAMADLNGDGKLDLAIGTRDAVCIYKNTGTASAPVWTRNDTWRGALSSLGTNLVYVPALGDVDGDGLVDVLIGGASATILAYKNVGTASAPAWSFRAAWGGDFVKQASALALADVDGDGLADMFVADEYGNVFAFQNMGASATYRWRFARRHRGCLEGFPLVTRVWRCRWAT